MACFANRLDRAEAAHGTTTGVSARGAGTLVLLYSHFQMEAQLVIDVVRHPG
jgi:hypothetical protein